MLTVHVNVDGVMHTIDTLAYHADNLTPALKRFAGYLKAKTQKTFEKQNFAPLAPATIRKREQLGLRRVESKLGSSLRSALTSGKARESTKERRAAILLEFQKQYKGGESKVDWQARGYDIRQTKAKLSLKQVVAMNTKVNKTIEAAVNGPILGRLGKSLRANVENGTVALKARTKREWSDVHNEGDGHNPQRQFMKLDDQDLNIFVAILKEHFLVEL